MTFPFVGSVQVLGLRNAQALLDAALAQLPADAPQRASLQRVRAFAKLAADNLDLSRADPRGDRLAGAGQADRV